MNAKRKENISNDKFLLSLINILEEDVYQAIGKKFINILMQLFSYSFFILFAIYLLLFFISFHQSE